MDVSGFLFETGRDGTLLDVVYPTAVALGKRSRALLHAVHQVGFHCQFVFVIIDLAILESFRLGLGLSLQHFSTLPEIVTDAVDE